MNVSKRWFVHFAAAVSVVSATISCLPCQAAKLPGESRDRQTSKERRRRRRMRRRRSRSCDCNPESTQREREGGGAAAMRTSVTDGSERPWHFLHFSNCCGGAQLHRLHNPSLPPFPFHPFFVPPPPPRCCSSMQLSRCSGGVPRFT